MFVLLLLKCGDVERNSGPCYKFPCGVCSNPVKSNQKGIQCDLCDQWYHINCEHMPNSIYDSLSSSVDSWFCSSCSLPNLSDSFFNPSNLNNSILDLSSQLSNSYISTSSESMESCDTVFPVSKFCVFHANVRSFLLSIDDLKVVCYEKSPDVFVVSETWLDPSVGDEVSIPAWICGCA